MPGFFLLVARGAGQLKFWQTVLNFLTNFYINNPQIESLKHPNFGDWYRTCSSKVILIIISKLWINTGVPHVPHEQDVDKETTSIVGEFKTNRFLVLWQKDHLLQPHQEQLWCYATPNSRTLSRRNILFLNLVRFFSLGGGGGSCCK